MIEEKINEQEYPIIGAIGAASPTVPYNPTTGVKTGYFLRELIEKKGGSLFTGGMEGVGIDIYVGIALYCKEHKTTEDHFFVLFPEGDLKPADGKYEEIASKVIGKPLTIIGAGKDFEQRRAGVAEAANLLVVLNGGDGTTDEVIRAIQKGKRVYCLRGTGGTADLLIDYKECPVVRSDIGLENKELIIPVDSIDELISKIEDNYKGTQ
ncbi:hypothetical protein JW756_02445 [Candidatus Woesearchaeota archaeon]|nr:hypothetical protein [Candidatus Woesearchaeota archaeon]